MAIIADVGLRSSRSRRVGEEEHMLSVKGVVC